MHPPLLLRQWARVMGARLTSRCFLRRRANETSRVLPAWKRALWRSAAWRRERLLLLLLLPARRPRWLHLLLLLKMMTRM